MILIIFSVVKIHIIIYKLSYSWEIVRGKHRVCLIFSSAEKYHLVFNHVLSFLDSWSTSRVAVFSSRDSCVLVLGWATICCFRGDLSSERGRFLYLMWYDRHAYNHFWMWLDFTLSACVCLFWVFLLDWWAVYRGRTIFKVVVVGFGRLGQIFWIFCSYKRKWHPNCLIVLLHCDKTKCLWLLFTSMTLLPYSVVF